MVNTDADEELVLSWGDMPDLSGRRDTAKPQLNPCSAPTPGEVTKTDQHSAKRHIADCTDTLPTRLPERGDRGGPTRLKTPMLTRVSKHPN